MTIAPLVGILLASVAAAPSDANSSRAREVATEWMVLPLDPLPAERVVHPHEIVFRQRVLPAGYLRTAADAVEAKSGKVALPAGTDFYRLRTTTGVVACALRTQKPNAVESVIGVGKVRYCLVDRDGTAGFDAIVAYVTEIRGLPAANGRLPKSPRALANPVPYETLDPRQAPDDLYVGIEFEGNLTLATTPHFETVFGRGAEMGKLGQPWRAATRWDKATRTGTVVLDGAELTVAGLANGDVRIATVKGLPAGAMTLGDRRGDYFY